jgi:hypothetical protein
VRGADHRQRAIVAADGLNICHLDHLNMTAWYSSEGSISDTATLALIQSEDQCQSLGLEWANNPATGHFDDIFSAFQTVFLSVTSGYISILHEAMDATEPGVSPQRDASHNSGLAFFVTIQFVFTLFLMNIFIGVISKTFSEATGKSIVTETQQRWRRCHVHCHNFNPSLNRVLTYEPVEGLLFYEIRILIFQQLINPYFVAFANGLVALNAIFLASEHYPLAYAGHGIFLYWANHAFQAWFLLEMVLRLLGFGFLNCITDPGIAFDSFLITGSILFPFVLGTTTGLELLRVFRAVYFAFSEGGFAQSLQGLLTAVAKCLLRSTDILLITGAVIYVYAIVGMQTYGLADLGCGAQDCYTNFVSFGNAAKALVQIALGDQYGELIGALAVDPSMKHNMLFAFFYFSSFYFASSFVCINLFVVSVLDNFESLVTPMQILTIEPHCEVSKGFSELSAMSFRLMSTRI